MVAEGGERKISMKQMNRRIKVLKMAMKIFFFKTIYSQKHRF